MYDTKIYDFDLNLIAVTSGATTVNGFLYFNDIGTFEGHYPLTDKITDIVLKNKYLIISNKNFTGIITGKQVKNELVIYGRTLNWLLSKKVTANFEAEQKSVFDIVKAKILDVYQTVQNISVITSDQFSVIDYKNEQYTATFDVVKDLLDKDNAGHEFDVDFKNKQFIFNCFKGKELNKIISESFKNAYDTVYDTDILELAQNGYYSQSFQNMGDWDAEKDIPTLRDMQPLNYEKYYKVSAAGSKFDITFSEGEYVVCKTENGKWEKSAEAPQNGSWKKITTAANLPDLLIFETVLNGSIKNDAVKDLSTKKEVNSISAVSTLIFKKDYFLGDTIKIQMKKGNFSLTKKAKIIGVNFYFDGSKNGEKPILEYEE